MKKETTYALTKFPVEVIRQAIETLEGEMPKDEREQLWNVNVRTVLLGDAYWWLDSLDEFYAEYRKKEARRARLSGLTGSYWFGLTFAGSYTQVEIGAPSREQVERVSAIFADAAERSRIPKPKEPPASKPTLFIGHGRDPQWRDLKDHLQDQHGYPVIAYEVGSRAGHAIRDVLEEMMGQASFAILVMTGEDEDAEGKLHARPNVIHEIGLFQGKLGFTKAIVLLEEGTEEFSNLNGIQQIRFGRGHIKSTFGDILATIAREFPDRS